MSLLDRAGPKEQPIDFLAKRGVAALRRAVVASLTTQPLVRLARRTSQRPFATMDSNNSDNGRPIERTRSRCDASGSASRSGGETRKCHPEKLIDASRAVRPLGTAFVDDGAALISAGLASVVASKAFRLRILTENRETGENNPPYVGQAGLIRESTPCPVATAAKSSDRGWRETHARSSLFAL